MGYFVKTFIMKSGPKISVNNVNSISNPFTKWNFSWKNYFLENVCQSVFWYLVLWVMHICCFLRFLFGNPEKIHTLYSFFQKRSIIQNIEIVRSIKWWQIAKIRLICSPNKFPGPTDSMTSRGDRIESYLWKRYITL